MATSTHHNILFLIADDWSPLAACYGNGVIQTPHIDQFASQGVVFDQAYCTSPSCAVSRACILTGQHSHTHGQYGHCHGLHHFQTFHHMRSTPAILKEHGYVSALIGKNHVSPPSVYPFDEQPAIPDKRHGDQLAQQVKDFLTRHPDRPFYLHVASMDPHRGGEGVPGAEYDNRPRPGHTDVVYDPADVVVPDFLPDNDATRQDLAAYYQAVSRWDQTVGKVLNVLEESGRAENTLVFVTTDHAMPFPGAKASSYDTGHRCPLIMRHPTQNKRGIHNRAMVNWVDIHPTILDWAGIEAEESVPLPGRSLLPVLEDETDHPGQGAWEQTFLSHCFHELVTYFPYRVLHGRQYKLVHNLAYELPHPLPTDLFRSVTWTRVRQENITRLGQRSCEQFIHQPKWALYDLSQDPMETRNLIDDPALTPMVANMRQQLLDFRIQTHDPWLELSMQHGDCAPADIEKAMAGQFGFG